MEQNDADLRELLREWKAPEAPASLEARVLKDRPRWWQTLLHGYIRVPVPLACALAILMIGAAWHLATSSASGCTAAASVVERHPASQPAIRAKASGCTVNSSC